jgi:DNA-directed RNA polymerase specialized sigma24 family protein
MLGIAEGTSKSQVHKARLRIREYLAGAPRVAAAARRA